MELGVYVHFPWCHARCPYCDFAIAVARRGELPHRRYADAVLAELDARAPLFPGRALRSIYFGGGTPSIWDPAEIARVVAAVRARWGGDDLEITVEANPEDAARFAGLREAGANRLSIGGQSFDDGELVFLGRDHRGADTAAAVDAARAAGFGEVSLDLIHALPGRGPAAFRENLDRAVALAPPHLSVYQLTVEPRTTFGAAARAGRLRPVADDDAAAELELAHERLGAAGYEHYEVSSYARAGHRARHNSLYWTGAEYLGLGNGAHSFRREGEGAVRWAAHRSVVRYLAGTPDADLRACGLIAEITPQGAADVAADRVWLGMRTRDGVPRALLTDERPLAALAAAGLVEISPDRVRPTPRGLLFADEIGARLLE
jgi:putative oxygen-independent coproporphyrinogen III oxidase